MSCAVVFTEDGARIYNGVNPEDYIGVKNVLINPKIPKGVPPHLWRLVDGEICVVEEGKQYTANNPNHLEVVSFQFSKEHYEEMARFAEYAAHKLACKICAFHLIATTILTATALYLFH